MLHMQLTAAGRVARSFQLLNPPKGFAVPWRMCPEAQDRIKPPAAAQHAM